MPGRRLPSRSNGTAIHPRERPHVYSGHEGALGRRPIFPAAQATSRVTSPSYLVPDSPDPQEPPPLWNKTENKKMSSISRAPEHPEPELGSWSPSGPSLPFSGRV